MIFSFFFFQGKHRGSSWCDLYIRDNNLNLSNCFTLCSPRAIHVFLTLPLWVLVAKCQGLINCSTLRHPGGVSNTHSCFLLQNISGHGEVMPDQANLKIKGLVILTIQTLTKQWRFWPKLFLVSVKLQVLCSVASVCNQFVPKNSCIAQ